MPDTLDFSNNRGLQSVVDFTKADFYKNNGYDSLSNRFKAHFIFLRNTPIAKIKIDYIHFKLLFTSRDKRLNATDDEREAIYRQLLKQFDENNQVESFKKLDIEYHFFLFDKIKLHWLGIFFYYWWEFGYHKEYIFFWVITFILCFTGINFFLINFLNQRIYKMDNIPRIRPFADLKAPLNQAIIDRARKIKGVQMLMFFYLRFFRRRLWYAFVYTCSVFFKITLKIEKLKFANWLGCLYLMLIYTSGLLSLAYLANYVLNK